MADSEIVLVSDTQKIDDVGVPTHPEAQNMPDQQSEIQMPPIFIEFDNPEDVLDQFEMCDIPSSFDTSGLNVNNENDR